MQTKFQLLPLPCCFACLRFFAQKRVLQIVFFVWLPCGCSQLCVCKVPSDICCFHHVGTLLHRHFAFLTLHFCCFTKQQIRFLYLLLSSTFQRQKIAFVVFFAFEITCALQKRFAYCLVLGRIFPQAKAVLQCVAPFEYNVQGKPDFVVIY